MSANFRAKAIDPVAKRQKLGIFSTAGQRRNTLTKPAEIVDVTAENSMLKNVATQKRTYVLFTSKICCCHAKNSTAL
jgi:hypothetical protein